MTAPDPTAGESYCGAEFGEVREGECECPKWSHAHPDPLQDWPMPGHLKPDTPAVAASTGTSEDVEDDGPECSNCGKSDCPDADLPEFSEPRKCEFASIYEAFRASKDCDYGCGRDYSMQAVRLWMLPEVDRIIGAREAAARAEERRVAVAALIMTGRHTTETANAALDQHAARIAREGRT